MDVSIPVQVEQQDDASAACFDAEVFHADVRQPAVRVRVEPTGSPQSVVVRVQSSALVNEPVVSVTLRARCDLKAERRYVLLADLPKAADPTVPVQIGQILVPTRTPVPVVADPAPLPAAADGSPRPARKAARTKAEKPAKEPRQAAVLARDVTPKRASTPSGQSRLKLDNLELFSDRISLIEMEQPDAAADYVSPDLKKVQDMQITVDSLQALIAKNESNLSDLRTRLNQSESARFPAWLVYALAALILAAVAAIAVLWGRQRRTQDEDGEWWGASVVASDSSVDAVAPSGKVPPVPAPVAKAVVEPRLEKAVTFPPSNQWHDSRTQDVDVSEVEMGESRFHRIMQSGEVQGAGEGHSAAAPLDLVLPGSESFDAVLIAELRQQAEFFVALGQTDQALVVLEKVIHDSDVPNPHVFLDLLGLQHSLSKKIEFQRSREGFNRVFNSVVPEFARFKSEGKSLEAYPAVLADITVHWATPEALDCINTYVLKNRRNAERSSLDLAAFRDLLLLQSVVQQLNDDTVDHLGEPAAFYSGIISTVEQTVVDPSDSQFENMMALDLDLSDVEGGDDSGHDGLAAGNAAPATIPTGLKANDETPSQNDNLIDFDLPDVVKPDETPK
ncbi:hypothetical protein [Rhodoferax sp. PAMC 29310]|uniref:hypothetical protein n=1 Tax=Rhodoferax sp. PAMC 29310 TaxID=2822760 RepID=UPI001B337E6F|nr:hypothetical protein [Rhodoferax sp. PAMC 29310]